MPLRLFIMISRFGIHRHFCGLKNSVRRDSVERFCRCSWAPPIFRGASKFESGKKEPCAALCGGMVAPVVKSSRSGLVIENSERAGKSAGRDMTCVSCPEDQSARRARPAPHSNVIQKARKVQIKLKGKRRRKRKRLASIYYSLTLGGIGLALRYRCPSLTLLLVACDDAPRAVEPGPQ
jgi:hypothetical protein